MSKTRQTTERPDKVSFPLSMPRELDALMSDGAKRAGLSKSDFMRLSMQRGADLLIKALSLTPEQLAGIPVEAEAAA